MARDSLEGTQRRGTLRLERDTVTGTNGRPSLAWGCGMTGGRAGGLFDSAAPRTPPKRPPITKPVGPAKAAPTRPTSSATTMILEKVIRFVRHSSRNADFRLQVDRKSTRLNSSH